MSEAAWRRPVDIVRATLRAANEHGVVIGAAGCAFFSTLAVFPAMSILIAVYGLLFNPRTIEPQLQALYTLLPDDAYDLLSRWIHHLVLQSRRSLGIEIGIGTAITVASSTSGTRALLATLAASHGVRGGARPWREHLLALVLTTGAIAVTIGGIALLTLMPIAAATLGLPRPLTPVVHATGTILLVAFASLFLALLYRITLPGPSRDEPAPRRRHVVAGALLATAVWLLACWLISFYVDHIARIGPVYGPVGAVIGLMLWLYATFYAALMGAELNAQLDHAATDAVTAADLSPAN